MDERWRGERERTAACLRSLQRLGEERPRYGMTQDADAWALRCEAVREEAAALRRDIDARELDAHLRSSGLDREAFDRLSGAMPEWQATADALRSLETWQARVASMLDAKAGDGEAWRSEATALLAEGRKMAQTAIMGSPDMEGAGFAIEEAMAAVETAADNRDVAALRTLTAAVAGEAKETGRHPLDAAHWPDVVAMLAILAGRTILDDETRDLVAGWQARRARWEEERSRVVGVIGDLHQRATNRPRFAVETDRTMWRRAADAALAVAEDLKASLPKDQLAAHLAGLGGEPGLLAHLAASLADGLLTADALDDLNAWRARVASALAEKTDDREAWRSEATALLEQGRTMSATAVMRSPDMAGAGPAIDAALRDIGAALLADEVAALRALDRGVNREVKEKGGVALDADGFPELAAALDRLDGRDGLDDDARSLVAGWRDAISGLQRRRNEVAVFYGRLQSLDDAMTNHERQGTSLPAVLRREADDLSKDAEQLLNQMPGKEQAAHIRSAGGRPGTIAAFLSSLPQRLAADDTVRDEENRRDHLVRLGQARRRLRVARTATWKSRPWTLRQPLVPGDRLVWRDDGGARDEIVMEASFRQHDGRTTLLVTVPAAAAPGDAIERSRIRDEFDLVRLDARAGVRRLVWPDEAVREMEIGRQHPSPDEEFSLRCEDRVVEGDCIRWVMEPAGLLDDRPQVEARVERIEPVPGKGDGDVAVLTVIRSWGLDDPPAPGSQIRQTMAALMERSCVRQRRDDEDVRAAKLAEAHERIRAYRPGPSWGFRM